MTIRPIRGYEDHHDYMLRHIKTFPTLARYETPREGTFICTHFAEWALAQQFGLGATYAAAWILHLWNRTEDEILGEGRHFDIRDAWSYWDIVHQEAWRRWAMEPYFP